MAAAAQNSNRQSLLLVLLFAHRDHATVRYLTFRMFELNGGVVDTELAMETLFDIAQDALTG